MSKLTDRLKELAKASGYAPKNKETALPDGFVYQPDVATDNGRNSGDGKVNAAVKLEDKVLDAIKKRLTDGSSYSFTAEQSEDIKHYIDWLKNNGRDEEELISQLLMEARRETGVSRDREVEIEKELRDMIVLTRELREIGNLNSANVVCDSYNEMSDSQLLAYVEKSAMELKPIPFLTKDQALMVMNSGIWKNWSAEQLAGFQSTQRYLCVGLHEQREAASKILGRTITFRETTSDAFDKEICKALGISYDKVADNTLSKLANDTSAAAYENINMDMQELEQGYGQSQGFRW